MVRTFIKPENQNILLQLPQSFIGKRVEVIAFIVDEAVDSSLKEPVETYSASEKVLAKDWLTPEEEKAWKDL